MSAAIFWLKARAGWREKLDVTVSATKSPMSDLSDAELERMIRLLSDQATLESAKENDPALLD